MASLRAWWCTTTKSPFGSGAALHITDGVVEPALVRELGGLVIQDTSTTHTRSRSGSEATARSSWVMSSVPPVSGGTAVSSRSGGLGCGTETAPVCTSSCGTGPAQAAARHTATDIAHERAMKHPALE